MKINHFTLLFVVLSNVLLSIIGARLKCPSVYIANGTYKIRSKGRIIAYKCSQGYYLLGEPYAACIKGKWDSNPPVCLKSGCPPLTSLQNGEVHNSWKNALLKFTCNRGYKLIGPSYIYCNGRQWNAPKPQCQAVDIKCNFENKNTCNWIIDDNDDDDFNWRLQQHEPASRALRTGPLHDHTLSPNTTGHYLVLDTSDYIPSSKPARIHSPPFPKPSDNSSCFIFWYHMYGNTIGSLNVFLNNVLALQMHGNHGDRWIKGVIPLSGNNVTISDLQIIIEGSYGGGYTGDIGLDDFSIGNGTYCITNKVKSCVGRCYEDKNEVSACLCNPECSVDNSCCDDFLDVCSIESTTPFFEASTGVEDSTQVYTDTSGTTDYETIFSETPISSTELEFTAALENSTGSSSFTSFEDLDSMYSKGDVEGFGKTESFNNNDSVSYFPSTKTNHDKEIIKNSSTVDGYSYYTVGTITGAELNSPFTSSYFQKEQESTNANEGTITVNRFSPSTVVALLKNILTTKRTTLSYPKNNFTVENFYNSTSDSTSKHYYHFSNTNSFRTISTLIDKKNFSVFLFNSTKTTIKPLAISTKTFFYNVSTEKTVIPNYKTENRNITTRLPFKVSASITKEPDINKNFTTQKTQSTKSFPSTKVYQTTHVPKLKNEINKNDSNNFNSTTSKSVTKSFNTFVNESHLFTISTSKKILPVQSSTNATLKHLKTITPSLEDRKFYFRITTASPLFYNITALTTDQTKTTTTKVDNKKIVNDSHTHLQTTSLRPPLFNTTEESVLLTSILTNTVPIKPNTVNSSKKWKSIYKPKDKFMFSAVQRNRDSNSKTYVILSACAAVIGIISISLVVLFIRRRRLRLVNELEEGDTDILYHSSQEMLDLHVARPNH